MRGRRPSRGLRGPSSVPGFEEAITRARERVGELAGSGQVDRALARALEELRSTVEELHAANAALQEQHDELEASAADIERERLRHRALFEMAPDGYLVTDRSGLITEANRAAATLLRRAAGQLAGKPLATFVPVSERRVFRAWLRSGDGEDVVTRRLHLQPVGGEPVPVSMTVSSARGVDGELLGHRWILHDESAADLTRAELRESEARYRAIVETAPDGIITIDPQGTVQTMNPAAGRMFGYRPEEVIGRTVTMLIPPAWDGDHDGAVENGPGTGVRPVIGSGREVQALRRDGSVFPVELSVSEFQDGDMQFVASIRDLTARRDAEEARRRFEEMLSESEDLMAFVDRDYVFQAVNDAYARALGVPVERIVGHDCAQVLGPLFEEDVRPRIDRCLAGARVRHEQWRELPSGERRYLDVHYAPHRDSTGAITGVVLDARDRTGMKRLEEEAQRRRDELAHVARVSSLGELASGLAHELNQPLTAIASYCDGARRMVQRGTMRREVLLETLSSCAGQARRAGDIIRRLRALVRREPGRRETVDVNDLVNAMLGLMEGESRRRNVVLIAEPAPALPFVRADRVQIEQVVLNLVRNAIEAVDEAAPAVRRVVVRTAAADDGAVEVQVQDSGPGLTEAVAQAMFDPFFTTKAEGMGVGLSVCRTIVEAHGGTLEAGDGPGGGALLRFSLPPAGRSREPSR